MKRFLLAAMLLACASSYAGVLVAVSPSTQSVAAGSQVSIDIKISGLGSGTALGTFDFNVAFDPALLAYSSFSYGSQLNLFGLGDIQSVTPGAGTVNVFELSLESVSDLNTLQAPAFLLATLTFDTLSGGTSPLTLAINALGDASGNSIAADLSHGSVTITSSVPEPATYALMLAGLGLFGALRKARARA